MRRFLWGSSVLAAAAVALGCSSSTSANSSGGSSGTTQGTSSSSGSTSSGGAGACGLAFFPADYDKACQGALDKACCSQEQACAANPDCVKLIACIDACPPPRQDACVNACGGDGGANPPGLAELDAIANCSKQPPYSDPPGVRCAWPR